MIICSTDKRCEENKIDTEQKTMRCNELLLTGWIPEGSSEAKT